MLDLRFYVYKILKILIKTVKNLKFRIFQCLIMSPKLQVLKKSLKFQKFLNKKSPRFPATSHFPPSSHAPHKNTLTQIKFCHFIQLHHDKNFKKIINFYHQNVGHLKTIKICQLMAR